MRLDFNSFEPDSVKRFALYEIYPNVILFFNEDTTLELKELNSLRKLKWQQSNWRERITKYKIQILSSVSFLRIIKYLYGLISCPINACTQFCAA